MDYYFIDINRKPFKVSFENFKKYWDKNECKLRITNNIIGFFIPYDVIIDENITTEYRCNAFIIIN